MSQRNLYSYDSYNSYNSYNSHNRHNSHNSYSSYNTLFIKYKIETKIFKTEHFCFSKQNKIFQNRTQKRETEKLKNTKTPPDGITAPRPRVAVLKSSFRYRQLRADIITKKEVCTSIKIPTTPIFLDF